MILPFFATPSIAISTAPSMKSEITTGCSGDPEAARQTPLSMYKVMNKNWISDIICESNCLPSGGQFFPARLLHTNLVNHVQELHTILRSVNHSSRGLKDLHTSAKNNHATIGRVDVNLFAVISHVEIVGVGRVFSSKGVNLLSDRDNACIDTL
jgi:hypothetical protein